MSFDTMVETQPVITVRRSSSPTQSNDSALSNPASFADVETIRGRLIRQGPSQQAFWATLGISCNYQLDTKYHDIRNGDIVQYSDPRMGTRIFRVKGTRGQWMGDGSIDSYLGYPVEEISRT